MTPTTEPVRDFVLAIEKTLSQRRLYAAGSPPRQEASQRLAERFRAAVAATEGPLALRLGAAEVVHEKTVLLSRTVREESPFFPLFRDGLRELTFSPSTPPEELDALLDVLEAEERRALGADEDLVGYLWKRDLREISFTAVDGLGDGDGEGSTTDKAYGELVGALADRIRERVPEEARRRSLSVDVKVGETDLHYETTTTRRSFEENPTVLGLLPEEAEALRAEVARDREAELLDRFVEALFTILWEPTRAASGALMTPLFEKLLDGYWRARDYLSLCTLLLRLKAASEGVPAPENRAAAKLSVDRFMTAARVQQSFDDVLSGTLALDQASLFWENASDKIWDTLVACTAQLPDGTVRRRLLALLRQRLSRNPPLLAQTLTKEDPELVRVGFLLLDERLEPVYEEALLALTRHPSKAIRLRALAAAGRLGTRSALAALWHSVERDPAKGVRLRAFRILAERDMPGLTQKLKGLVLAPAFAQRPMWERARHVTLLAQLAGESVRPLFEYWVRPRRTWWLVRPPFDAEKTELGLRGMLACGRIGAKRVQVLATGRDKVAEVARRVLATQARYEARLAERAASRSKRAVKHDGLPRDAVSRAEHMLFGTGSVDDLADALGMGGSR